MSAGKSQEFPKSRIRGVETKEVIPRACASGPSPGRLETSGGGLIVLVVSGGDRFQIFRFKDLIAIQATDIIHTIAPCQYFGAGVIAGRHKKLEIIPILSVSDALSSPQIVPFPERFLGIFYLYASVPSRGQKPTQAMLQGESEHDDAKMFAMAADLDRNAVEQFKQFTRQKLHGLRCPQHRQPPRLHFSGYSLRDVTISMTGCCEQLMALANARIASPINVEIRKPA